MKSLNYYITLFTKLKRAHQFGGAPHKPVLLLSILDAVERGYIHSERIYIPVGSDSSIKQLPNTQIILPINNQFNPRKEVLEWHRGVVFEKWM